MLHRLRTWRNSSPEEYDIADTTAERPEFGPFACIVLGADHQLGTIQDVVNNPDPSSMQKATSLQGELIGSYFHKAALGSSVKEDLANVKFRFLAVAFKPKVDKILDSSQRRSMNAILRLVFHAEETSDPMTANLAALEDLLDKVHSPPSETAHPFGKWRAVAFTPLFKKLIGEVRRAVGRARNDVDAKPVADELLALLKASVLELSRHIVLAKLAKTLNNDMIHPMTGLSAFTRGRSLISLTYRYSSRNVVLLERLDKVKGVM